MKNFIFVLGFLMVENTFAKTVKIPDMNFLNALVIAGIDKNGNGKIESEECEHIKSLDVSNREIHSLTGIDAFIELDSLNCSMNIISSIDLNQNKFLIFLDCSFNVLTVLRLEKNLCLSFLDCQYNVLDKLSLNKNTLLTELICNNNQIKNLNLLQNTHLKNLRCLNNDLTSFTVDSITELININYTTIPERTAKNRYLFEEKTTIYLNNHINSMDQGYVKLGSRKASYLPNSTLKQVQKSNTTMQNKSADIIFYRFQNSGLRR